MSNKELIEYPYVDAEAEHTNQYLWKPATKIMATLKPSRVFDLGCGNGAFARHLKALGHAVEGVDPSEEGIRRAREADPDLRLDVGNAYEALSEKYGRFDCVVSLEVVEHVYFPRKFARCVSELLDSGGHAIISTPYHGYLKNLMLAATGALDAHFTALWDHGHIKFWSVKTLTSLFAEQNLRCVKVFRVGRIPVLAKSMILVFRK